MNRFVVRSDRAKNKSVCPSRPINSAFGMQAAKDWNAENAEFVAAYNELIDVERFALEEYRLF